MVPHFAVARTRYDFHVLGIPQKDRAERADIEYKQVRLMREANEEMKRYLKMFAVWPESMTFTARFVLYSHTTI